MLICIIRAILKMAEKPTFLGVRDAGFRNGWGVFRAGYPVVDLALHHPAYLRLDRFWIHAGLRSLGNF